MRRRGKPARLVLTLHVGIPTVPAVTRDLETPALMPRTLYLIDGHAQIFRAYYAPFRDLTSPSGEPTRATHVFCQMLLNMLRDRRPDYLAMVLDAGHETTFRHEIDPQYKANRDAAPEDLGPQIDRIVSILKAMKIPILVRPGFEADDILATLARRLRDDVEILLVSSDKDLEQLLDDRVRLYDPRKNVLIDPDTLKEKKGYVPDQAVEIQTLVGDSTDNIPGVKGIGPKTAAKLINKYGTAEAVLAHADELTPKMAENVRAFAEQLPVTRQLVTLRSDVDVSFALDEARCDRFDLAAAQAVFKELGFTRLTDQLVSQLGGEADESEEEPIADVQPKPLVAAPSKTDYQLVDDDKRFDAFLTQLSAQPAFAFDTETTGLNPVAADLVGMSFSWEAGQGFYLPVRSALGERLDMQRTLTALKPILEDPAIRKCGQNIKYDLVVMRCAGVNVAGVEFDTMLASFVLDATRRSHGMDHLAHEFLDHETIPISDLIGKGKDQITIDQANPSAVAEYASEDADITWRLKQVLEPQVREAGLDALLRKIEVPLVPVLADMEFNGVALDSKVLARMSNRLGNRLMELTGEIHAAAGHEFNIDSPKQLGVVLFDELGLRVVKRTKTSRSTDADTLATLAFETDHALPKLVLEYRELSKLKNTYVDALPEAVCPRTGRIHASFDQTGAVTGRLSSSNPNLQNIPIRTETGREIRKAFVAGDANHVLLAADYSQIELRVLAHFCGDAGLVEAFANDQDIHAAVASQVFSVPVESVTKEQRGRAKTVNFGIIYGQTPFGLARQTGMSVSEAKEFIQRYFARYPGIQAFIDKCVADAASKGHAETILGRRRRIETIRSRNRQAAAAAERLAVNTVVQGSAADLIKTAMINIHRRIGDEDRPARMLIQVHDELVFEVPRDAVEAEADMIRREMIGAMQLAVPLKVDLAWGANWLEGK